MLLVFIVYKCISCSVSKVFPFHTVEMLFDQEDIKSSTAHLNEVLVYIIATCVQTLIYLVTDMFFFITFLYVGIVCCTALV